MKASASECASLVPVLANFLEQVYSATTNLTVRAHAMCMMSLCDIIASIRSCCRGVVNTEELKAAIDSYMVIYRGLYGPDAMVPKFHALHHYPGFIRRWGYIPNCWCLERKHKHPKSFANQLRNTAYAFEAVISREVTCRHLSSLLSDDRFSAASCLVDGRKAGRRVAAAVEEMFGGAPDEIFVSRVARVNEYEKIMVGDIVLCKCDDGSALPVEVRYLVSAKVDDAIAFVCLAEVFELVAVGARSSKFLKTGVTSVVDLDDVYCACIFAQSAANLWTVLHPTHVSVPGMP